MSELTMREVLDRWLHSARNAGQRGEDIWLKGCESDIRPIYNRLCALEEQIDDYRLRQELAAILYGEKGKR